MNEEQRKQIEEAANEYASQFASDGEQWIAEDGFIKGVEFARTVKNEPQLTKQIYCIDCKMSNFCLLRHQSNEDKQKHCIQHEHDELKAELTLERGGSELWKGSAMNS